MSETDECVSCHEVLTVDQFYSAPQNRKGRTGRCRHCILSYMKDRHDPRRKKDYDLRRQFGITVEQYEAMKLAQGGRCAICRRTNPRRSGDWLVDHNHSTGAVRALLCSSCNSGLGLFGDDPNVLRSAAAYIEEYA